MSGHNNHNSSREYFTVGIALKNPYNEVLLIQEAQTSTPQPDDSAETSDAVKAAVGKWRLPYDRLHEGDDLPRDLEGAASVIGTNLTSYDFDMCGICYLSLCEDPHGGPSVVAFYVADQPYDIRLTDPLDPEKVAARGWFTYDYLLKLNEEGLLRDPELTLTVAKNAQQGIIVPLELTIT